MNNNPKTISVKVPEWFYDKVNEVIKEQDTDKSKLVRAALREYFENHNL